MSDLRIKQLVVDGLRGSPQRFVLNLDGKSVCVLGENGTGKTTIADAAELWSTGDLSAFHREGCAPAAAIHLDASSATIEITGTGFTPRRRTLSRHGPGELEPRAPIGAQPLGPIPVLRHATIANFMSQTAGEKKKALLELLGLGGLNDLREPLRTCANLAKRDATAAADRVTAEKAAIESQLGGEDLVTYAEDRRIVAGLQDPIHRAADLLSVALDTPVSAARSRAPLVDQLAAAVAALPIGGGAAWNAAVADQEAVRADGMAALLRAAQRVLSPEDESCPLCQQPIMGAELAEQLSERAERLDQVRAAVTEGEGELTQLVARIGEVMNALAQLLADAPPRGWPQADVLAQAERALREHRAAITEARTQRTSAPPPLRLEDLEALLPTLREAATAADSGTTRTRALIDLAELRQKCIRLEDCRRAAAAAETASRAAARILKIADEEAERAINAALTRIGKLTADYYGRLVRGGPFTDIELVYKSARSGQVEFSLTFDGRHHAVTPPQRIMSTSQQNALGIALHLARLKLQPGAWRTLVLDDVINSFDAPHRQGLARLLSDEFADWQVIALTHDRSFKEILSRTVKGWRFKEIIAFSPRGGPDLDDADPRVALRARMDHGAVAMEVGNLARRALEQGLATPLRKLEYEIRYDPDQRYGAADYLQALRRGFKHKHSPLKDLPVLDRMQADSYMATLGVHERTDATALTTDDLYRLVDDLDELDAALCCQQCHEPVWRQRRSASGGNTSRCGCGALAA
jgi:hypothetical protein